MGDSKETSVDLGQIVVWEGEWPKVKAAISGMRFSFSSFSTKVNEIIDAPMYIALARRYTSSTDDYVSSLAAGAHARFQQRHWVARATGIVAASTFLIAKTSFMGPYKAFRNGALCAAVLVAFLFPVEISRYVDKRLSYSTAELKSTYY